MQNMITSKARETSNIFPRHNFSVNNFYLWARHSTYYSSQNPRQGCEKQ